MPGLIGASMFSPRPGRGYRFHSLQVEIIAPSQPQKLQPFSSKTSSPKVFLRCNLNILPQEITSSNRYRVTLSWLLPTVTDAAHHPPAIAAKCCSFVSSRSLRKTALPQTMPTALAHHEIGGKPPLVLAGSRNREEDQITR